MPSDPVQPPSPRLEFAREVLDVLRIMRVGNTLTEHQNAYLDDAIDAIKGLIDAIEYGK